MNTINRDTLIGQLNWRYATKQFDPQRKINKTDWDTLAESLVLTPSSYGLQPWRAVVVSDPKVREKLVAAAWGQRQVADASHFVVLAIKKDFSEADVDAYVARIAQVRGVSKESLAGYRDMMVGSIVKGMDNQTRNGWSARQTYIALGNLLSSAALLGIDACPMEGIVPAQFDEILGLKEQGLQTVVACALGYRAASDAYAEAKKVRFPKEEVLLAV
jgi:nitroreductase